MNIEEIPLAKALIERGCLITQDGNVIMLHLIKKEWIKIHGTTIYDKEISHLVKHGDNNATPSLEEYNKLFKIVVAYISAVQSAKQSKNWLSIEDYLKVEEILMKERKKSKESKNKITFGHNYVNCCMNIDKILKKKVHPIHLMHCDNDFVKRIEFENFSLEKKLGVIQILPNYKKLGLKY